MSLSTGKHFFQCQRYFGSSTTCRARSNKHLVKYKNRHQEPKSERTAEQRLLNRGKSKIPYDKNIEISAKNTGPHVEGGSELAAKLAAKHDVPPTGYINKFGKFVNVPNMKANLVVPDLTGFKLKPYVPYRTMEVNQTKFTAEDLYRAEYKTELEEDMTQIELGKPLEEVISERLKMFDEEDSNREVQSKCESNSDTEHTKELP